MRVRRLLLTACLGLAALSLAPASLLSGPGAAARAEAAAAGDRTGAIVVQFEAGATLAGVGEAIADAHASATASSAPSRLVRLVPAPGQSVDDAIASLAADGNVVFAEPEHIVTLAATPNDTYYGSQWHYPQINLPQAWDITTGNTSVIVGVIDTGVMLTHPDLDSKITSGANAGWDFVNNDSNATDDHGHGTFVAGIIAAESNNASWVAGVCWTCQIMPLKALDATGSGNTFNVAAAIDWARTHGANVVNLSLAASANDLTLQTAVNNAYAAGVVVVAATGNDNASVKYPAAYANSIAVGSNNSSGVRSSFSNFGPEIDVMAPGENVVSTILGGGYGAGSGTSFAAPHVAGVVGLMMANGITDPATIATRLTSTATDMDAAGFDNNTGWGRINAQRAVDLAPTVSVTAPAASATVTGSAVGITATAADDLAVSKVRFEIDGNLLSEDTTAPYAATWNSTLVTDGAHTIAAKAYDGLSQITTATVNVTVVNNDTTKPNSSITAPAASAVISGASVPFTSTATDNVGVAKVRFWAGSTYLGFDQVAPYSRTIDTTLFPNGDITLKIEALDAANNSHVVTRTVRIINPDATPPSVTVDGPSHGATISGSAITVTATASDTQGVQKVQFWAGSTYLGYDSTAPYTRTLDSTLFPNGSLVIKAKAIDWGNNSAQDTNTVRIINPDATPPAVTLDTPADGATISGTTVTVTATASDTQGVQKVQFWAGSTYLGYDSTAPYTRTLNSTLFLNGPLVIKAKAIDWGNNSAEDTSTVTVSNPDATPPTVTLTGPADGATVSGTITITATATDNLSVNKVRFWVDGTYLGFDTTAPYARTLDTTTLTNGQRDITVQSVDNAGNLSTPAIVTITVSN